MNRRVDGSVSGLLNALARLGALSNHDQMHGFELTYATTGGHGGHDLDVLRQVSKPVQLTSDREAAEILTAKIEAVLKGLESYSARRSITDLELHHLPIADEVSVARFARVLASCPALVRLSLFRNGLGDAGIAVIAASLGTSLESLEIRANNMTRTKNTMDALFPRLAGLTCLRSLDLSDNQINISCFGYVFVNCAKLAELRLNNSTTVAASIGIFEISIRKIPHLSLTVLELNKNGIRDVGVALLVPVLRKCANLKRLSLSDNEITSAFSQTLDACLTALEYLDVSENAFQDSLQRVLARCTCLTHLNLNRNGIVELTRLAPALQQCTSLLYLDLGENKMRGGIRELFHVTTLTHLNLGDTALEEYLDDEASMREWREWMQRCTSLGSLDLHSTLIDWPATQFNACPSITRLDLSDNSFSTANLPGLALPNLTYLNLSRNESIEEFGFEVTLPNLRHLALDNCGFLPTYEFVGLMRTCSALTHLDLAENGIHDASVHHIVSVINACSMLRHVDLSENKLGDKGAEHFKDIFVICEALAVFPKSHCQALEVLNLSYNKVSVKMRQELETGRQKYCKTLVILQLEADNANSGTAEEEETEEM